MKLHGHLDHADRTRIAGWVRDLDAPHVPVSVIITANGELVARVLANTQRADLLPINQGNGRLAFDVDVHGRLSHLERYVIEASGEVTGEHLIGSPCILEPSKQFDAATKASIVSVLEAAETEEDFADRLTFLADQTEALLGRNDRRRNRQRERALRDGLKWRWSGGVAEPAPATGRLAALVVDRGLPVIDRDAGSVAVMSHMQSLQRLGYAVTFLPADLNGDAPFLETRGIACLTRPWYTTVEEALARNARAYDLIYVHRVDNAALYARLIRHYHREARLVLSIADLSSLRLWRQAEIEQLPELRERAQFERAAELNACHQADAVITHSHEEARLLRAQVKASKVHVVPWAVPLRATTTPFAQRRGLAFIGGFAHKPNVDAAHWLVTRVMPEVARSDPSLPCLLVGSDTPDWLRTLAGNTVQDAVQALGHVNDLATVFERIRLTIAPLAYGAGIKGKVLASLAAGIPCVCTPMAAEGLDLPPPLLALIATEPADLAAIVLRLHNDEDHNRRCAEAGLAFIATHMSDQAIDVMMTTLLG